MAQSRTSIWSRKLDMLYVFFFSIHWPISLAADCSPVYPASIKSRFPFLAAVTNFYVRTYNDKFYVDPPSWFGAYLWMELLYHVPLSLWAVPALIKDKPTVPLHLLIWAVQTSITTLTTLIEMWSWTDRSHDEKIALTQLYAPYLALGIGMGIDMFFRLRKRLVATDGPPMVANAVVIESPKDK